MLGVTGTAALLKLLAIIFSAVFVTSLLSGIFGMAGGLILMGVFTAIFPLSYAMVLHGVVQLFANGWRAFLIRQHIQWRIVGRYLIGVVLAIGGLCLVFWQPDKQAVFIMLGVLAFVPWIPKSLFALDVNRPFQAEVLGFIAQALNTLAGVVGPVLDIFFVKSDMTRQQIVATKGATQVIAHLTKIGFWTLPVLMSAEEGALPPIWLCVAALPVAMTGTWVGGKVLDKMTDVSFRSWTKYILTAIGVVYLMRGFELI